MIWLIQASVFPFFKKLSIDYTFLGFFFLITKLLKAGPENSQKATLYAPN